jgi:hypothetical protein
MKKNILYALAAIFLMLACKKKPETESNTKIDKIAENAYLKDIIGVIKNGEFVVNNADAIIKHWNNKLREENIDGVLKEIEIVKAKPEDSPDTFYILVAKSEDKKTKVTVFLVLKDDKLYFEIQDNKMLSLSICQGCIDGCNPGVNVHEGLKSIVCSPCQECMKGSVEVY